MRLFIFCLFFTPAVLSAQGIQFETKAWAAVLAKAKAEHKLVFLDAYASWCGPCKMMSNQTFTDPEVAKFYAAHFVNAKIDMEKGEGPALAKRYKVEAYPTLLYIDEEGAVVHRELGYHDAAQFIAVGTAANDPAVHPRGLDLRYTRGDRDPAFIVRYLAAKYAANDPDLSPLATEYLSTQTDWALPENMKIIQDYVNDPVSKPFTYFMNNRAAFITQFGEDAVLNKAQNALGMYLQSHEQTNLEEVQEVIRQIMGGEQGEKLADYYAIGFQKNAGDLEKFSAAAVSYYSKYPQDNVNQLNEVAWAFYESIDDPKLLETALGWAKKSVELGAVYSNTDTLAALYAKLGRKKEAIKYAKQAIELAKKSGDDYTATQTLLDGLNK